MREHIAVCSSLTMDGTLSKLNDLLWNHENSYLYEGCMKEQNARDTQFLGFAKALWEELELIELEGLPKGVYPLEIHRKQREAIARRAYDLVTHSVGVVKHNVDNYSGYIILADGPEQIVRHIPDMTELPKEESKSDE